MIATRVLGWCTAILSVLLIVLSLCMALQGSKMKALKVEVAQKTTELTEAYRSLNDLQESSKSSLEAVESSCKAKDVLDDKRKVVKKRVKGMYNVKASDDAIVSELSDSMWVAYCDGEASLHCPSK